MKKQLLSLLLFATPLFGFEYEPWLPPLFEFQAIPAYHYGSFSTLVSGDPAVDLTQSGHQNWLELNTQVSPYPYFETQLAILFDGAQNVPFSFMGGQFMLRYQWWDDTCGDIFSLVSSAEATIIRGQYLQDLLSYITAVGTFEFGGSLGKSFYYNCMQWQQRAWLYAGFGFGTQGSPWANASLNWDWRVRRHLVWTWRALFRNGLGVLPLTFNNNRIGSRGYSNIGYRYIDLETQLELELPTVGFFRINAIYNVEAENSPINYWELGCKLKIPFSL